MISAHVQGNSARITRLSLNKFHICFKVASSKIDIMKEVQYRRIRVC